MFILLNIVLRVFVGFIITILTAIGIYKVLPSQAQIIVPFTSQAPNEVWVEPWQNACEEASILMIDTFYTGSDLTKDEAVEEILKIFSFKEDTFGPSADESMELVAAIINTSNLTWRARVVDNPTIEDIKSELAAQRPIIAPIYAPALENPYYSGEGPDYHVVVITGFDDKTKEFFTHDPGTKHGSNYRYDTVMIFLLTGRE